MSSPHHVGRGSGRADPAEDGPEIAKSSDLIPERQRQVATTGWSSMKPKEASGTAVAHAMEVQRTRSWSKALGTRGDGKGSLEAGNSDGADRVDTGNVERAAVAVTRHGCGRGESFEG